MESREETSRHLFFFGESVVRRVKSSPPVVDEPFEALDASAAARFFGPLLLFAWPFCLGLRIP